MPVSGAWDRRREAAGMPGSVGVAMAFTYSPRLVISVVCNLAGLRTAK